MQAFHNFVSHALPLGSGSHEAKPAQGAEGPGTNAGLQEPVLKEPTQWKGATKTLQDNPQPVDTSAVSSLATGNVTGTREEIVPHESVAEGVTETKDVAIKGQEEMNLSNLRVSVGKEGVRNKAVGGRDPATINEQGSEDPNKEGKTEGLGFLGGLVVHTFQPLAAVVGEGASVLMGGGDDGAAKREAANVEAMEALENVNSPTTPHGTPLLERLVQLEQQMSTLEDKYPHGGLAEGIHSPGSPTTPTTPSSLEKRVRPAKSVLLEAEAKGTLVERVQLLEKRLGQHSMDLEKAYPSGRFGSNGFDLKHTEPHYIQEAPKLAETPRTEILETGPVTSKEVLPPAHVETAAPRTLVTEVSMTGLQQHGAPAVAPVADPSTSPADTTTGTTGTMQSLGDVSAKPPLVYEFPTQVPTTSKDSIVDLAPSETSVASNSATAASAEPVTELGKKNFETIDANHTPVAAPVVAVTKQEPVMQGSLASMAAGKQLDEPVKESTAKVQELKPMMKVVEKPVAQAATPPPVTPPSVTPSPVTPPPASDPSYLRTPQPIAKQDKKHKIKNFTQRCVHMFKNKNKS